MSATVQASLRVAVGAAATVLLTSCSTSTPTATSSTLSGTPLPPAPLLAASTSTPTPTVAPTVAPVRVVTVTAEAAEVTPTASGTVLVLKRRPASMPKMAGAWKLEEHPGGDTWHYHGPAHMTLTVVSGDLTGKLATLTGVDRTGPYACVPDKPVNDCFVAFPGGYLVVAGLGDAATVRSFLAALHSALDAQR